MDWRIPRWWQALVVLGLTLPVAAALTHHFSPRDGFLSTIHFGSDFRRQESVPELDALEVPAKTAKGYDGQYYAKISLDPLLRRDDILKSLDSPRYRAGRIGLPLLAFLIGAGDAARTLHAYSILNVAFWLLLVVALCWCVGLRTWRDALLLVGMTWSVGAIVSIERALADLPAAVVSVWAILEPRAPWRSAGLIGLASLFKETTVLSLPAAVWPAPGEKPKWVRLAGLTVLGLAPLLAWMAFLEFRFPDRSAQGGMPSTFRFNFDWPFVGLFDKIRGEASILGNAFGPDRKFRIQIVLTELVCLVSILVQTVYLTKPRWSCPIWRWGVAFAVMMVFLAEPVWEEFRAYTRVLLPLTFAFNLLIHAERRGRVFAAWWVLGNASVAVTLLTSLGWLARAFRP